MASYVYMYVWFWSTHKLIIIIKLPTASSKLKNEVQTVKQKTIKATAALHGKVQK